MSAEPPLLLALDLTGTFVFGLNGALTAVRVARLDIVAVVALGMATALGGGVIRDVLIGSIPPATFRDWRFFALAVAGGLIAFVLSKYLHRLEASITVLDAIGLSVFAVIGTNKAVSFGLGVGPALLLGAAPQWAVARFGTHSSARFQQCFAAGYMRFLRWSPRQSPSHSPSDGQ